MFIKANFSDASDSELEPESWGRSSIELKRRRLPHVVSKFRYYRIPQLFRDTASGAEIKQDPKLI